jgi:hypothetical protein
MESPNHLEGDVDRPELPTTQVHITGVVRHIIATATNHFEDSGLRSTILTFLIVAAVVRFGISPPSPSTIQYAVPFFWTAMGVFSCPVFIQETALNFVKKTPPVFQRLVAADLVIFKPAIFDIVRLYATTIILLMDIVRTASLRHTPTLTAEVPTLYWRPLEFVGPMPQQQPLGVGDVLQQRAFAEQPNCYPPNSDIAGLGVRISVYMLLWSTLISLMLGTFHGGQSGTKELGIAVMSSKKLFHNVSVSPMRS